MILTDGNAIDANTRMELTYGMRASAVVAGNAARIGMLLLIGRLFVGYAAGRQHV